MSIFYDNLVQLDSLRPQLRLLLANEDEVSQVLQELDHALHHVVMEVILRELPQHVHEPFIVRFKENPNDGQHLVFLRQYVPAIEELIRQASESSKQKFLDAIHD